MADSNDKFANGLVNIQRNGSDGHESGGRIKTRLRTRFAHQKSNSIDYGSGRGPLVGKKTGSTRDLKQIARKASRRPERSKSLGSIHRLLHLEPKGNHNGLFEESLGKDAATKFAGSLLSLDLDTLRRLRTAGELSLPKFFEIETEIDISTADMDCKGMRKSVSPRGSLKDDHRKRDAANENARPVAMSKIAGFFRALSFNNVSRDNNKGSMPLLLNPEHPMSPDVKRCKSNDLSCIERSNSLMNERDMLVKERDKAIEEWTRAATKWEQLLDEMDTLMSELIQVIFKTLNFSLFPCLLIPFLG